MRTLKVWSSLSAAMAASLSAASAAPMTFVEVFGVDAEQSASATGEPFGVEVSQTFSADEFGAARADIGTLGVSAAGSFVSTASFTDEVTVNGGAGLLSLVFDIDGSFVGSPAFLDITVSSSVAPEDASVPMDSLAGDSRSSIMAGDPPASIATTFFGDVAASDINYNNFTPFTNSVELSIEPFEDRVVDGQMVLYLAYEVATSFEFSFEMTALGSFGSVVDFFGTAELVGVEALDPVTLAALDDPTLSVGGNSGTDYIALAASNAGADPIPIPGAIWLMGAGVALLSARHRKTAA